jgi:CheY-like chemotaxis protein
VRSSSSQAVERHSASHYGTPAVDVAGKLRGVTIVVVDDDPEARSLITVTLRQAGASVTTVASAQDALAELKKGTPDVVLTDIAMPHVDGYQLAQTIRGEGDSSGIKLIALSAFPASENTPRGGFDAYLNKPIDPFQLVESIASIMGR